MQQGKDKLFFRMVFSGGVLYRSCIAYNEGQDILYIFYISFFVCHQHKLVSVRGFCVRLSLLLSAINSKFGADEARPMIVRVTAILQALGLAVTVYDYVGPSLLYKGPKVYEQIAETDFLEYQTEYDLKKATINLEKLNNRDSFYSENVSCNAF